MAAGDIEPVVWVVTWRSWTEWMNRQWVEGMGWGQTVGTNAEGGSAGQCEVGSWHRQCVMACWFLRGSRVWSTQEGIMMPFIPCGTEACSVSPPGTSIVSSGSDSKAQLTWPFGPSSSSPMWTSVRLVACNPILLDVESHFHMALTSDCHHHHVPLASAKSLARPVCLSV